MEQSEFTVLLIRGDSHVKRLRFGLTQWRFMAGAVMGFAFLCMVGTVLCLLLWKWHVDLQTDRIRLQRENLAARSRLKEAELRLASLQNLEKFLKLGDQEDVERLLKAGKISPKPEIKQKIEVAQASSAQRVNAKIVTISGVSVSAVEENRYVLKYSIKNLNESQSVRGKVLVELLTKGGQAVPIELGVTDSNFRIQRLKIVSALFSLPQFFDPRQLQAVRLTVTTPQGGAIFRESYRVN